MKTAIIILNILILLTEIPNNHAIYPRTFIVDEIDTETNTIILLDGADLTWKYKGIEDYQIGDLASAIMDDNGTPDYIYDDKILELRYGGIYESARERR